jgi:hypothetical protein
MSGDAGIDNDLDSRKYPWELHAFAVTLLKI